ncbi:MAG: DNA-protecting protein DprA [Clostridia bacterium]|nr:DNA-protecting protein DprA [Clostridia bacterium]
MNRYIYWVWLRLQLDGDIKLMYALWKVAGSVERLYQADRVQLETWGVTPKHIKMLLDKSLRSAHNIFGLCEQFGFSLICIEDDDYPDSLRRLALPPCLLTYQGDLLSCLSGPSLTVIGTRYATASGEALAYDFANHLARAGFAIFCGVAEGIESAVHRATVGADGKCVLLLPYGMLTVGKRVSSLIREVLPYGAVVSEWLPEERGGYDNYQIRNRLLSGFTCGTVIVQAPHKSGAMMTAGYALEQGKDVFVLPGGLRDPSFAGNNELLRDGATPAIEPGDIVRFYQSVWKDELQAVVVEDDAFESVIQSVTEGVTFDDDVEKTVYSLISSDGITVDEIAQHTGIPAHKVLSSITIMELKGWIAPLPGGKYKTII